MNSAWSDYAQKILGDHPGQTIYDTWQYHAPTLGYLLTFRPPPARLISIGCSLGMLDAVFMAHGYEVLSVDNDPAVLAAAERLSQERGFGLRLEQADAFDLTKHHDQFDVAFSAGLLEHWHGREMVRLLKEHARCAPVVQAEVPTPWTWHVDSVEGVSQDMSPVRAPALRARALEAGLRPIKMYSIGGVPSRARVIAESLLPPVIFRRLQLWAGLSMGVGVIAHR